MRRHQIVAALAGALLALPLHAAPGDIPEKRLFGNYDRKQIVPPQAAPVETRTSPTSTAPSTRTASPTPTRSDTEKSGSTKLSPGNERIAYAIAKGALAEHGIKNPTQEQIKTAMRGGTVTTKSGERITMPGVLKLREKGMGWGQIAQQHGFKLGEVMGRGHDKHHHHKHAHRHDHKKHHHDWKHHAKHGDWKHHGRPDFHRTKYERPEKFERPQKHERPERPERHGRGR